MYKFTKSALAAPAQKKKKREQFRELSIAWLRLRLPRIFQPAGKSVRRIINNSINFSPNPIRLL